MKDELERRELPIQSIYQKNRACIATVPVHLDVLALPEEKRTDPSLIADAKDVVKPWYDEDMEYYINMLIDDGMEIPHLLGYERFRDDWMLAGRPDKHGFLSLLWCKNGDVHGISFNDEPSILLNQHDEFGDFYSPEYTRKKGWTEGFYRNDFDPESVFMSPEKMRKYGIVSNPVMFNEDIGIAEVVGNVFRSEYHRNMAKTLLLRDFAVFYLNRLLDKTNGDWEKIV